MAKKFLKVKCKKCENEQVIFGNAASKVTCQKCGTVLALPRGGKADIQTKIVSVLE